MSAPISEENLDRIRRAVHHAPIAPDGQIENGQPWAATRDAGVDAKTEEILVLLRDVSHRIAALEARLGVHA